MDDKNEELINKQFDSLFINLQNFINKIPYKDLDNNEIKNEVKKSFTEINFNYDLSTNSAERSDEKYIRIEKYEDYEFTHCIAYEMATRNSEVIKLTNIVENLNILNYYLYDSLPISKRWELVFNSRKKQFRNFIVT